MPRKNQNVRRTNLRPVVAGTVRAADKDKRRKRMAAKTSHAQKGSA